MLSILPLGGVGVPLLRDSTTVFGVLSGDFGRRFVNEEHRFGNGNDVGGIRFIPPSGQLSLVAIVWISGIMQTLPSQGLLRRDFQPLLLYHNNIGIARMLTKTMTDITAIVTGTAVSVVISGTPTVYGGGRSHDCNITHTISAYQDSL